MVDHTSLTSVVSFYRDISYISFIALFLILVIQLSSIYSLIIIHTDYIHEHLSPFFYTLIICTSTFFFFLHTHWVTFWWPLICTVRCWMFYFIDQVLMSSYCKSSRGVNRWQANQMHNNAKLKLIMQTKNIKQTHKV